MTAESWCLMSRKKKTFKQFVNELDKQFEAWDKGTKDPHHKLPEPVRGAKATTVILDEAEKISRENVNTGRTIQAGEPVPKFVVDPFEKFSDSVCVPAFLNTKPEDWDMLDALGHLKDFGGLVSPGEARTSVFPPMKMCDNPRIWSGNKWKGDIDFIAEVKGGKINAPKFIFSIFSMITAIIFVLYYILQVIP